MRFDQKPGDYRVVEELDFVSDSRGEHYVHLLRKERLETLAAIDRVVRITGVPRSEIAYAGLKDRRGVSEQYLSIRGRRVEVDERGLSLRFVARSAQKISSGLSSGNRFDVVVRDLPASAAATLRRNKRSLREFGLPNYFDDQRFACLARGQGFVLHTLLKGRAEQALRQLLAAPPKGDRHPDAKLRSLLARNWGDWEACSRIARGPMYEAVFGHLRRRPRDAIGALARLPMRLKLIHLYAYQSFLWNRALSSWLRAKVRAHEQVVLPSKSGPLCCWRYLREGASEVVRDLDLPLIDAGTKFKDSEYASVVRSLLAREGLSQRDLGRPVPEGFRLVEEPRMVLLLPSALEISELERDERNPGRSKLRLGFKLPRGAYASLVIRRLFADRGGRA